MTTKQKHDPFEISRNPENRNGIFSTVKNEFFVTLDGTASMNVERDHWTQQTKQYG